MLGLEYPKQLEQRGKKRLLEGKSETIFGQKKDGDNVARSILRQQSAVKISEQLILIISSNNWLLKRWFLPGTDPITGRSPYSF